MTDRALKEKWEPAKPLRRPDSIQSSELGHRKHFYPSYDKEPVDMFYLIGMEYQRMWAKERTAWEEQYYPIPMERKVLKIRAVKKKKTATKKAHAPLFKMKKFQNVPARTDHGKPQKTPQTGQMKPCTCDPDKHKQGDHSAVSKVDSPKPTAREKGDEMPTEKEKMVESGQSDIQNPDDHNLDSKSQKSHHSECKSNKSHPSQCKSDKSHNSECKSQKPDHSECKSNKSHYSDCKSHKSVNSKGECSHTKGKKDETEQLDCCCDKLNEAALKPVSKCDE